MPLRRRRELPPELATAYAAFRSCAAHVDLGQRAIIRCVPSSPRAVPLPLDVGAETLQLALSDAATGMAAWRRPELEGEWQACADGLAATRAGVEATVAVLRSTDELERALTAVQDLLDPLHAFVDAEAAFVRLRQPGVRGQRNGADSS
jgi:hypothetical protein